MENPEARGSVRFCLGAILSYPAAWLFARGVFRWAIRPVPGFLSPCGNSVVQSWCLSLALAAGLTASALVIAARPRLSTLLSTPFVLVAAAAPTFWATMSLHRTEGYPVAVSLILSAAIATGMAAGALFSGQLLSRFRSTARPGLLFRPPPAIEAK